MLIMACQPKQEESLSTDIIDNPVTANGNSDSLNAPIMTFAQEVFDFGEIVQGEKVTHDFTFTNEGKKELLISSALGSCGCTVPTWPKEPIAPGKSGVIKVEFNSNGKRGAQHKRVTLIANTYPNKTFIAIKGTVLVPSSQENSDTSK